MSTTTATNKPRPDIFSRQSQDENAQNGTTDNNKKLINLIRGWPAPNLLPADQLKRAADDILTDPTVYVPALQYGPDPGYQPLREEIASWLGKAFNLPPDKRSADEICITGGASQSIANILQCFTDPAYTRAVWFAAPCYFLACPIFEDAGFAGRLRGVPEDEEGIDLGELERRISGLEKGEEGKEAWPSESTYKQPGPHRKHYRHVIYVVPTCANPSGKTMSLRRRQGLVELARKYDALVLCDDVYDLLQWPALSSPSTTTPPFPKPLPTPSPMLPRLSDIDIALGPSRFDPPGKHFGHAMSNGSFSKLLGPGLRTGWAHGTADFAHGLSQTGSSRSGGAPSQFAAAMVREVLASGELDAHLTDTVRPALQARHATAVAAVKKELGWAGVEVLETSETGPEAGTGAPKFGGYFLWLTLPEGIEADEVAQRAKAEENLIVAPGSLFEVLGEDGEGAVRFPRNIRVTYSWLDEADLVEGIVRLGRLVRRMVNGEEVQESFTHTGVFK